MSLLDGIHSPLDVKRLSPEQTTLLAEEVRTFLVDSVSQTGGHLGPNLGVVELTIALHRVFDSPRDTIIFDTGHQSYVHKLLTGRQEFGQLRKQGGLSGYPSRSESEHDVVENSHASTSLSWADGVSKANAVRGLDDHHVVAVIGDGALTGGMSWEALNNIAAAKNQRLVIVVNDNGRSYDPTIGGLAHHLNTLRTTGGYERFLAWGKRALGRTGKPGQVAYGALHGLKKGLRDVVMPQGMFQDLGLKYLGPIDGHDTASLERSLRMARDFGGPVIVHVNTEKGRGYVPAEQDMVDRFHGIGPIHTETGLPLTPSRFGWTSVFAEEIVEIGRDRDDVVAITAAMLKPVGLAMFAAEFPDRVFDVGIAEQHAVTAAAGMAFAGLHPVVALYATFLNRAFDQVLMDVALHGAGVTFVLDRAGITGDDGASHNGMWDMALMRIVPGLHLAAPRDESTMRAALRAAVDISDAPSVVRYPKGPLGEPIPLVDVVHGVEIIGRRSVEKPTTRILIVGVGSMAGTSLQVADLLNAAGYEVTVASPTWVLPLPAGLVTLASQHDLTVTIEDGLASGGIGALLSEHVIGGNVSGPVMVFGLPSRFLDHASRAQIIAENGLDAERISGVVLEGISTHAA